MIGSRTLVVVLVVVLVVLAACSTLPSVDDPRTSDDYVETGTCAGNSALCEYRSQAKCNSGCQVMTGCHSDVLDICSAITDANACDGNASCRWSLGFCEPNKGIGCSSDESQVACTGDPVGGCAWGPACTGYPTSCYELHSKASCIANAGCTWTPG